jgi:uncharacterized protein YndB with AHSA1/START domain/catechol 2,3-dioxygenase-like lactoylglutathione lyase family enzyme
MPETKTQVLSDRSFTITHTFRVPAAKVFAAYTDPKQVVHWWAPRGGTMTVERLEPRPGGTYRYVQRTADGRTMAFQGSYLEVKPVTRLVYTFQVEGQPNVVTTTVELAESAGTTTLTLTNEFPSKQAYDVAQQYGATAGAKMAMKQLAAFLEETPAGRSPLGNLGYTTLFVADQDKALTFYTKGLGFELVGDAPQPGGHRFIALNLPGQDQYVVLWPGKPGQSAALKGNLPGHLIFRVPDIDAAFAELKARGVPMEQAAPVKAAFASFVTVIDPDGNRLMVQQQNAQRPGGGA